MDVVKSTKPPKPASEPGKVKKRSGPRSRSSPYKGEKNTLFGQTLATEAPFRPSMGTFNFPGELQELKQELGSFAEL